AAVGAEAPAEEAGSFRRGAHDRRARTVAEDDGGPAVGVVEHSRQHLRTHNEHRVRALRGDERVRYRQRVDTARAGGKRVPGHSPGCVELVLDPARYGREGPVWRRRAHQDHVQVFGRDARRVERRTRRFRRQLERGRAGLRDVPAADAGALDDPLVGRVHHLLEVEVRDDLFRRVYTDAGDRARPALGLERAERHRIRPRAVAGRDGHRRYASNRSAVFCSRNFHRSAMVFMFSSSASGSSTSYLSSIAAISSTRSSESAARSRAKLLSIWTWSSSMPRISPASFCRSLKSSWVAIVLTPSWPVGL